MGTLKKRCVIIGGGDCSTDFIRANITENDYIICADSGYDYVYGTDIVPDFVIGDFDSAKSIPENIKTVKLPVEKDITDCAAALNEAVKYGYSDILLLGGTGGRFEHTFANISIMAAAANNGCNFEMADEKHRFYCIHNSKAVINKASNEQISVFAFGGKAYGVTEKGFHYPLDNFTLDPFIPLGISNDVTEEVGVISVKDGTLIIIKTQM